MELEERIKEELESNPALEYSGEEVGATPDDPYDTDAPDDFDSDADDEMLRDDDSEKIGLDDYLRDESDDGGGYDYSGDNEKPAFTIRQEESFHQQLLDQLSMLQLDEHQTRVAEQIIGSINDDGYLSREVGAIVDDLAFGQNVLTTEQEVQQLIRLIQTFDPPGIAAYTLQECLLVQLRMLPTTRATKSAIDIIQHHYESFIRKHFDKIQKQLSLTEADFRKAVDCIVKLNPKPGLSFGGGSESKKYIIPDFFVDNENGILQVMLNSKNAPELRISEGFKELLQNFEKTNKRDKQQAEAVGFIKQKLESAQWFIDSIKQRQHTLLQTMRAIVDFQKNFFLTGDETTLRPMILKDIAQLTDMDISTVSRVANSKFVQTEFGTYSLKFFFAERITMDNGEEVSNKEIKSILSDIIAGENKQQPYRDEVLTEMLAEKGYNISRRTVSKYREQLMIPVARLRRE
jgi:RNA polymerase sigma-54 factor